MILFLIDAQLRPALARWLTTEGHRASYVGDIGMQAAPDTLIWEYAHRENAAIITKDEDFAQLKVLHPDGPIVIWIRLPNTRRAELLRWFAGMMPAILAALERGETLIELT